MDARSPLFFFALEGDHPVVPVQDGSESRVTSMSSLEDVEELYNVRGGVKEMVYMYFVSMFQLLLGSVRGRGVSVVAE